MNDVNCTGDENQLTDCPSSDRIGSCEHHDDVGVVCNTGWLAACDSFCWVDLVYCNCTHILCFQALSVQSARAQD